MLYPLTGRSLPKSLAEACEVEIDLRKMCAAQLLSLRRVIESAVHVSFTGVPNYEQLAQLGACRFQLCALTVDSMDTLRHLAALPLPNLAVVTLLGGDLDAVTAALGRETAVVVSREHPREQLDDWQWAKHLPPVSCLEHRRLLVQLQMYVYARLFGQPLMQLPPVLLETMDAVLSDGHCCHPVYLLTFYAMLRDDAYAVTAALRATEYWETARSGLAGPYSKEVPAVYANCCWRHPLPRNQSCIPVATPPPSPQKLAMSLPAVRARLLQTIAAARRP